MKISKLKIILFVVFLVSQIFNSVSSRVVYAKKKNATVNNDLLLDKVKYRKVYGHISELSVYISIGIFLRNIKGTERKAVLNLLAGSVAYILRGFLLNLTPMKEPHEDKHPSLWYAHYNKNSGMFPSGHTIASCLAYSASAGPEKVLALTLVLIQSYSLLASKGHYSIDIAGGVMTAGSSLFLAKKILSFFRI
jgi:membrane-associated phospholipid phosphatase